MVIGSDISVNQSRRKFLLKYNKILENSQISTNTVFHSISIYNKMEMFLENIQIDTGLTLMKLNEIKPQFNVTNHRNV